MIRRILTALALIIIGIPTAIGYALLMMLILIPCVWSADKQRAANPKPTPKPIEPDAPKDDTEVKIGGVYYDQPGGKKQSGGKVWQ